MAALTPQQKDQFWRDGVLVVEDAVSREQLADLRAVFASWVEESRARSDDYGETLDGRARFDLLSHFHLILAALQRPDDVKP